MKIALSGTPGTGKTTIGKVLHDRYGLEVVDVNQVVQAHRYYVGWDERRQSLIVDIDALRAHPFSDGCLLEGHLSHHLPVDRVIVLRTEPNVLRTRLQIKGFSDGKIRENLEAEVLDVILVEAVGIHGKNVYEVDSTATPRVAAHRVWEIIQGRGLERFAAGQYDWTGYLNDA
jgi:adenylate kinase